MGITAQRRNREERENPRPPRPPAHVTWEFHQAGVLEATRTAFAQGKAAVSPGAAVALVKPLEAPEVVAALDKAGALLKQAEADVVSLRAEVATLTEMIESEPETKPQGKSKGSKRK